MEAGTKLGLGILASNLTGLLLGFSFWLLDGFLTALFGFLIGFLGSLVLIYFKEN